METDSLHYHESGRVYCRAIRTEDDNAILREAGMWYRVNQAIAVTSLWLVILCRAVRGRSLNSPRQVETTGKRVLSLLRRFPPEQAAEILCNIAEGGDEALSAYLWQKRLHVDPLPKRALYSATRLFPKPDQFDLAELLLWRGVRLYPDDAQLWSVLLQQNLRHVLYSFALDEWNRAFYRFKRSIAEVPEELRTHGLIRSYYVFESDDCAKLLPAWRHIHSLWFYKDMNGARLWLERWWLTLSNRAEVPQVVVRSVAWAMLGLGMFAAVSNDPYIARICPDISHVGRWFLERRPVSLRDWLHGEPSPPLIYTIWTQALLNGRVPLKLIYWAWMNLPKGDYHDVVFRCLHAASLPVARRRVRETLQAYLSSDEQWFSLPRLHFLCVAAMLLGWQQEYGVLRTLIEQFGIEYAAKADIDTFRKTHASQR